MTERDLTAYVTAARALGWTIVMTNGVFGLLHVGHIKFLQSARDLGHVLIVAVNDDDSTRRLKGSSRPVNKLEDRLLVLSALKCVDAVVPFSEDTPERLIELVRPDVLVKGGDYRSDEIAGRQYAGKVLALDYHAGYSTTRILSERTAEPAAS